MHVIIAAAHLLGTIITLMALGFATLLLSGWMLQRHKEAALQEVSLALGIPIAELDNPEHQQQITNFLFARSSSELLRNRLSDACGYVRTGWGWLSNLIQGCILIGVLWLSVTESASNAIYAWSLVGVSVFFWITSLIFTGLCKLFTGRYPGQALEARKFLAKVSLPVSTIS